MNLLPGPVAKGIEGRIQAGAFPKSLFALLAEQGWCGALISEEKGGAGLSEVEFVEVIKALSVVDPAFALFYGFHSGPAMYAADVLGG